MHGVARLSRGSGLGSVGEVWRTRKTLFKTKSCANFWEGPEGNGTVLEVRVGNGGLRLGPRPSVLSLSRDG